MNCGKSKELDDFMKKIWKYEDNSNGGLGIIFEIKKGVLKTIGKGEVGKEGFEKVLNFFKEYSEKTGEKINLLVDNTEFEHIAHDARNLFLKLAEKDSPVKKIATIGDNFFFRSFFKLYTVISPKRLKVNFFNNETDALEWLKKDIKK